MSRPAGNPSRPGAAASRYGRIELRGVRAVGRHGVYPQERADGQEFVVDAVLELDLTPAVETDSVAATVNYADLADRIARRIEGEPVNLIETLADEIAVDCLADPRVRGVEVTVHKPHAPVPRTVGDVAVRVYRRRPIQVVVALGANLGDRPAALQRAVDALAAAHPVVAVSPVYETEPVGGPPQPPYLNAVALLETAAGPYDVLTLAQIIEAAAGRTREVRWGPRTLDIDVICYGDLVLDDPLLTLPHPRAAERAFVLAPWHAVDPAAVLPGHGRVADLLRRLDTSGVRPREDVHLAMPAGAGAPLPTASVSQAGGSSGRAAGHTAVAPGAAP